MPAELVVVGIIGFVVGVVVVGIVLLLSISHKDDSGNWRW